MDTSNGAVEYLKERQEMIATCLRMWSLGYFIGTWGNISVRVEEGFLITPTRVDYDAMRPEDIVLMSLSGRRLEGERLPSSETELHRAFYQKFEDAKAVIHTHSRMASALSALHMGIPLVTEDMAQIIGGAVRCSNYVPGGRHVQLGEEAMKTIGEARAVILANHGVVCAGASLQEASIACEIVEKSAGITISCLSTGKSIHEISREYGQEERERYLTKYGKAADFLGGEH
jgi:L-fuculose-phosphate aldolase